MLLRRTSRLGAVAFISFLLNVALTVLLTETFHLQPQVSFAFILAFIFVLNFFTTRHWVFEDRLDKSNLWAQLFKCMTVSAAFRLMEWASFYWLLEKLHINYVTVLIGVLVVSFAIKSFIYDRFVFR